MISQSTQFVIEKLYIHDKDETLNLDVSQIYEEEEERDRRSLSEDN